MKRVREILDQSLIALRGRPQQHARGRRRSRSLSRSPHLPRPRAIDVPPVGARVRVPVGSARRHRLRGRARCADPIDADPKPIRPSRRRRAVPAAADRRVCAAGWRTTTWPASATPRRGDAAGRARTSVRLQDRARRLDHRARLELRLASGIEGEPATDSGAAAHREAADRADSCSRTLRCGLPHAAPCATAASPPTCRRAAWRRAGWSAIREETTTSAIRSRQRWSDVSADPRGC